MTARANKKDEFEGAVDKVLARIGQGEIVKPSRVSLRPASEIKFENSSDYLLKGLINPGDLSVWYGPSGCGKTFATLHIAVAVACGLSEVFGRRVRPASVALFALEGSAGFAKRLAAIQSDPKRKIKNLFVHSQPLTLFDDDDLVGEVILAIKTCGARLVIFDTLSRAMNGANENAAEDMTHMVGVFDRIRTETGAHVMLIHHTGKDEERGSRGHSSLLGAVDTEVKFSKDDTTRIATVTKSRDGIDNWKFAFKLKQVKLGFDDDKEQVTSCVVEETAVPVKLATKRKTTAGVRKLLEVLDDALDQHGIFNAAGAPEGVSAIDVKLLKTYALKAFPSTDAVRKVMERATTHGWIGSANGFVWPLEEAL